MGMEEMLPWGELLERLSPKAQRQALRSAMRRVGKMVEKRAVRALLASGLKTNGWVENGIRLEVYNRAIGFKVTTKPSKRKGRAYFYEGKPVAMWAAEGTELRKTKTQTKFFIRKKKGHITGKMPSYHFMEAAERALGPAEQMALEAFEKSVNRVAKKYL